MIFSLSSDFQTISAGQVYITIINNNDSILAILNNTMQTKQQTQWKKSHSYSNRNTIYKGLRFVVEGSLAENVQNLLILLIK